MDISDIPFVFRKGERYATFGDYGVIGDIHLGFEREMDQQGYNIGRMTDTIVGDILKIKSKRLIILGDIRSNYGPIAEYEGGMLFRFFREVSKGFDEIIITRGNHDAGLDRFTSRFSNVRLEREFLHNDVCFLHGHSMPSKAAATSSRLLAFSHLHPLLFFRDSNGVIYREDCWLFFDLFLPPKDYKSSDIRYGFVFPSFNRFIGGTDEFRKRGIIRYAENMQAMTMNLIVVNTNRLGYRYK